MDIEKEIFEYLNDKFNKCVTFKHDNYEHIIHFVYSENLCRLKKMDELYGKKSVYSTDDSCVILFQQDLKNQYFRLNYEQIWSFFIFKYQLGYQQIQQITTSWLHQHDKMKEYITRLNFHPRTQTIIEHNKMTEYTTVGYKVSKSSLVNEHNKMKEHNE